MLADQGGVRREALEFQAVREVNQLCKAASERTKQLQQSQCELEVGVPTTLRLAPEPKML